MGAYSDFVHNIAGIKVDGIRRNFDGPPSRLSTAQLPAMWPRVPTANAENAVLCGGVGLLTIVCELVVAIEPLGQGESIANFETALTIMDNLHVALTGKITTYEVERWTLRVNQSLIGDTPYWVIIASVEGKL